MTKKVRVRCAVCSTVNVAVTEDGDAEPRLMGVVNVTPDSFSDGGRFLDPDDAIAHGRRLAADGAALVDVGGESTRPGADPVPEDEERRRVLPVIEALAGRGHRGVDRHHQGRGGRPALEAGAAVVNDVSAFRFDPEIAAVMAAARGRPACLMHMLGEPRTMQDDPRYDDVVDDVRAFLEERLAFAVARGHRRSRTSGSTPASASARPSSTTSSCCGAWARSSPSAAPVVIGTSRKSFLGKITGRSEEGRLAGTVASNVMALERGAAVFRVHDVAEVGDALRVRRGATLRRSMGQDEESSRRGLRRLEEGELEPSVTVEVSGLSLYTHHGVGEAEREVGQRLRLRHLLRARRSATPPSPTGSRTPLDYADVCQQVALAAQERSYRTLERLCTRGGRPDDRPLRRRRRSRCAPPSPSRHRPAGRRGRRRGAQASAPRTRRGGERLSGPTSRDGYLGLGLERGRPPGEPARRARPARRGRWTVVAASSVYETEPQGEVLDQPDFLNAVLEIETALGPEELLDVCKAVERELGREPGGVAPRAAADRRRPAAARRPASGRRPADAAAPRDRARGASCSSRCSS